MKTGLKISVAAASIWGVNACKDDCDCSQDCADDCCCKIQNYVSNSVLPNKTSTHYLVETNKAIDLEEEQILAVLNNQDPNETHREYESLMAKKQLSLRDQMTAQLQAVSVAEEQNIVAQRAKDRATIHRFQADPADAGSRETAAATAAAFNGAGGKWTQSAGSSLTDFYGIGREFAKVTSLSGDTTYFNTGRANNNFDVVDHRQDQYVVGSTDLEHVTADASKKCSGACEAFCQNYGCGEVMVLLGLFQKSSYNGEVTYDAEYTRIKDWLTTREAQNVLKAETMAEIVKDEFKHKYFCKSCKQAADAASKAHTLNVLDGSESGATMIKGSGSKEEAFLRDWMYTYFNGELVQTIATSNLGTRCQTSCNQGCKGTTSVSQMGESKKHNKTLADTNGNNKGPEVNVWLPPVEDGKWGREGSPHPEAENEHSDDPIPRTKKRPSWGFGS